MTTAVTYQNIYNLSTTFPIEYTLLLTLISLLFLIYGAILILEDKEVHLARK